MKKIILNDHNPKNNLLIKYFITLACNNRCPYCFMLPDLNNKLKFNPEVFELFKTKINEVDRNKHHIRLEILGGDPLFINEINKLYELDQTNMEIVLYSNCNFKPEKFKEKIESLQFKSKIVVSVHQVSNLEYVKENIIYLQSINMIEEIIYILDSNSIPKAKEFISFFEENNLKYILDLVRHNGEIQEDKKAKDFFIDHYKKQPSNYKINNSFFTEDEILEFDLYNISKYFSVRCFTNEISVDYFGNISMNCNHEYKNHIKNGFPIKSLYCLDKKCDCAYAQYKELISPKTYNLNSESKKIINFVLNKGNQ